MSDDITRNEDGSLSFTMAGDTFTLHPFGFPTVVDTEGEDQLPSAMMAILTFKGGRKILAEAIRVLDDVLPENESRPEGQNDE